MQSMVNRWRAAMAVGALLSVACSGSTTSECNTGGAGGSGGVAGAGAGSGGGVSQAVCEQAANFAPVNPTGLFDDMEDGNGAVAVVAGRNGSWWLSTDGTDGTTTPVANQAPTPETIVGGRCGSKKAIRVTGQGFTGWGAVLTAGMAYSTHPDSVDLSSFTGLRFWARAGEQNTSAVRVQFQDAQTQPEGGQCVDSPGDPEECYNGFGSALAPLDTQWRLYEFKFTQMTQREFCHRGTALDAAHVYAIDFNLEPNSVFDLWIDDLWFF